MIDARRISTPLNKDIILSLKAGDKVYLDGVVYTIRDAAHKRLIQLCNSEGNKEDNKFLLDIKGQIIYYTGLTPFQEHGCPGSAGPTTSMRMDKYTPKLLEIGIVGMIGKGPRGLEVVRNIRDHKAIYFITVGGAGAYLAQKIKKVELVAFEDLGCEAIFKLKVKDLPLWVGIDAQGKTIWELPVK
jgi:fumarate hydratase subunit beta